MRILGHGIDIADVRRMRMLIDRFADMAIERQFTDREKDEAPSRAAWADYFAGRFAMKEAVLKALGVGFSGGVAFTDVEILPCRGGAPRVKLSGHAGAVAAKLGIRGWRLSISHAAGIAVASAIAIDEDAAEGTSP